MLKRLFIGLPIVLAIMAAVLWLLWQHFSAQTLAKPLHFKESLYELPAGTSVQRLCQQWRQQQQVSALDCVILKLYSKQHPAVTQLQQGLYRLPASSTLADTLALFRSGKVAQFSVTLIEGETLAQSWQRMAELPYLQQDVADIAALTQLIDWPEEWGTLASSEQAAQTLEGLFYPDTYFYTANSKASAVWLRSHLALKQALTRYWQQRQPGLPLQNPYELLVMASIIEKESGLQSERALVGSVFMNRLEKNMRLQTDPTVIYGLTNYSGRITRANLQEPHPYNTYRHHGLPPGPISLVSSSALKAAAQPDSSEYYYFVSRGDGSHVFSQTLDQHNAAVRKYILGKNNE